MFDSSERFEKSINIAENNSNIVDVLSKEIGFSKQRLKQIMQQGAVWLTRGKTTKRIRRATTALKAQDTVHFYHDPTVLNQEPAAPTLIADERHYSVWDKPFGMLSQGSKWGDHCSISRWTEKNLMPKRPSFIVHRLDRAANGLIIVAHEKKAAAELSKLFQHRQVTKRYHIWVSGDFNLQQDNKQPVKVETAIDNRSATSYFSLIKFDSEQNRSLLDVTIDTGRKHQIRRHSAELGFPVIGDRLYGSQIDEDLQLRAYYLAFVCPYSKTKKSFSINKAIV